MKVCIVWRKWKLFFLSNITRPSCHPMKLLGRKCELKTKHFFTHCLIYGIHFQSVMATSLEDFKRGLDQFHGGQVGQWLLAVMVLWSSISRNATSQKTGARHSGGGLPTLTPTVLAGARGKPVWVQDAGLALGASRVYIKAYVKRPPSKFHHISLRYQNVISMSRQTPSVNYRHSIQCWRTGRQTPQNKHPKGTASPYMLQASQKGMWRSINLQAA